MINKTGNVNYATTKNGNEYKKATNGGKIGALAYTAYSGINAIRHKELYQSLVDQFVESGMSQKGAKTMMGASTVIGLGLAAGIGALLGKGVQAIVNKAREIKADKVAEKQ